MSEAGVDEDSAGGAGPERVVKKEVIWRWAGSLDAPAKGRFVRGADIVAQRKGRSRIQASATMVPGMSESTLKCRSV